MPAARTSTDTSSPANLISGRCTHRSVFSEPRFPISNVFGAAASVPKESSFDTEIQWKRGMWTTPLDMAYSNSGSISRSLERSWNFPRTSRTLSNADSLETSSISSVARSTESSFRTERARPMICAYCGSEASIWQDLVNHRSPEAPKFAMKRCRERNCSSVTSARKAFPSRSSTEMMSCPGFGASDNEQKSTSKPCVARVSARRVAAEQAGAIDSTDTFLFVFGST